MKTVRTRFVISINDLDKNFMNTRDCPMATSAKRRFKSQDILGSAWDFNVDGQTFSTGNYADRIFAEQRKPRNERKAFHVYADVPVEMLKSS